MSELVEMLIFVVFFCGPFGGHVRHSQPDVLFTLSGTLYRCRCDGLPSGIASKYLQINHSEQFIIIIGNETAIKLVN
jgi:hypothetical protein